jgi:uncharacterized sulfatase
MSDRKLSRREFLGASGAVGLAFGLAGATAFGQGANAPRPNVLFLVADDLNMRVGCYGYPFMKTPNIDRLAARGVRFDRAYCQYPLCNPSRSSILTGRRPDVTKVLDNSTAFRDALPDVATLAQHFQRQGYWMARAGKIYHGGIEDNAGWDAMADKVVVPPEEKAKARVIAKGGKVEQEEAKKAKGKGAKGVPLVWQCVDGPDESQMDGQIALKGLEFLRKRPADKPFFIAVGFHKPHLPFVAPSKYFDLYPFDAIQLPKVPRNDRDDVPAAAYGKQWNEGVTDEQARELIRAYYACISFVDAQVGKLLDALEQAKLTENTVVLFWGDNGYHLTEHGLWRKGTLFEESCRVPLIAVAPGRKARDAASPKLVEFVDMYPTLAELCGLPAPQGLEGTSFAPLMDDPNRPWKKAAFTQVTRGRSMRTERWRYSEWGGPDAAELYDHQNDPNEYTNLAKDPKCADTVKEMHELLDKGWRSALP